VGHYLGLDVHDTNTIGPYRTLEPGVVLAIEPGLYIPNHPQFGPYAGIGVRIEDDVLITQTGCEVGGWLAGWLAGWLVGWLGRGCRGPACGCSWQPASDLARQKE
jgi:hypothetical protein